MDLTIFTADTESLIQEKSLDKLMQRLPTSLHHRALRYKSELSAYNYVVGRLLLKHGLAVYNLDTNLDRIEFLANDKPVISGIDFNISHSGHQVISAFSENGSIGVDLEKVKPIDFNDFTTTFTPDEWTAIHNTTNPTYTFYWFWTRKESIIKALGLNLSYLHQIELDVSTDQIVVDKKPWFLKEINLGDDFIGMACSEYEVGNLDITSLTF